MNIEAERRGAGVLFAVNLPDPEVERRNIRNFIARQVDGVILQLYYKELNFDVLRELQKAGIPLVLVDRYAEYLDTDYVVSDNFGGAREAMSILLDRGFTNNLFLRYQEPSSVLREREDGFNSVLYNHGLNPAGRVITLQNPLTAGWREAWEATAREAFSKLTPPIGIFACSSNVFHLLWPLIEE